MTKQYATGKFIPLVEALDRLAVPQHVIVSDEAVARRLEACPYVATGPVTSSPVMANCYMSAVDVVHAHDPVGGRAALLLALTRSVPYVLTRLKDDGRRPSPIRDMIRNRAAAELSMDEISAEALVDAYRRARRAWSEFPQDADRG